MSVHGPSWTGHLFMLYPVSHPVTALTPLMPVAPERLIIGLKSFKKISNFYFYLHPGQETFTFIRIELNYTSCNKKITKASVSADRISHASETHWCRTSCTERNFSRCFKCFFYIPQHKFSAACKRGVSCAVNITCIIYLHVNYFFSSHW